MKNYVVVAGGINVDIKGKSLDRASLGSSNPGKIELSAGGVGRNIAHNLALLKVPVILLSAVGYDAEGSKVLEETSGSGVCTEHVMHVNDQITGTYLALLDNNGEMIVAMSDMQILDRLDINYFRSKMDIIKEAGYIICDTNISKESIMFLKQAANSSEIPICMEPVSVSKASKLTDCLNGIDYITPNLDELEALSGLGAPDFDVQKLANALIDSGVKNVITTLGKYGLCYTNKMGSKYYDSIKAEIADVTGAGDSLIAGFIYGMLKYKDADAALKCGLAAASITLNAKETVSPRMSEKELEAVLKRAF
ncbi:MAG: carbohydrate kinase family protein [Caulobacteraceae bacterium]